LVKDFISSIKISKDIAYLTAQSDFSTNYQARISRGEGEDGLSMNLSLKSNDPKHHQMLVAFAHGGDTGKKDEDGKPIIVDATTDWVKSSLNDIQEASNKLTKFFIEKLEKRFSGDK